MPTWDQECAPLPEAPNDEQLIAAAEQRGEARGREKALQEAGDKIKALEIGGDDRRLSPQAWWLAGRDAARETVRAMAATPAPPPESSEEIERGEGE